MAISPKTKDFQIPHGDQAPPKKETGDFNHLSNLSDELLVTILSLLPAYTAVRTSVLCRHFGNFHEYSLDQHQIASLHNCHALESLKLAHKDAQMYYKRNQQCNPKKSRKGWQSRL